MSRRAYGFERKERPMADGASTDTPEDVIEAFIAEEVGWHTPLMREQARDLLAALSAAGWQIVRGEGIATGDELDYVAPVDVGCTDWCDDECEMNHYTEASWRRVGDR
jgi:hypothetical protein